jgi:hypothetical protein
MRRQCMGRVDRKGVDARSSFGREDGFLAVWLVLWLTDGESAVGMTSGCRGAIVGSRHHGNDILINFALACSSSVFRVAWKRIIYSIWRKTTTRAWKKSTAFQLSDKAHDPISPHHRLGNSCQRRSRIHSTMKRSCGKCYTMASTYTTLIPSRRCAKTSSTYTNRYTLRSMANTTTEAKTQPTRHSATPLMPREFARSCSPPNAT